MTSLHALCVFMTWTFCYIRQMYANCTGIFCFIMLCYVCNMQSYRNAYWLFPYCIDALCQLRSTVSYIAKCVLFSLVWRRFLNFTYMHFSNWFFMTWCRSRWAWTGRADPLLSTTPRRRNLRSFRWMAVAPHSQWFDLYLTPTSGKRK